jgi:hypothetical protein
VLRDPYTAKPCVLFYTTKRVGGGVQDFDAIKVMKFSASWSRNSFRRSSDSLRRKLWGTICLNPR